METYAITYVFEEKRCKYILEAHNLLVAIGEFNYRIAYDKIHKIELI